MINSCACACFAAAIMVDSSASGLPNAILEYISFGLPVVATNVGGVKEIIKDGINGYLVKKNNSDEMAKKIELLLNSKSLRKKISRRALDVSIKKFGIKNLKEYKAEYFKILKPNETF